MVAGGQAERHPLRDARGVPRRRRLLEVHLETGRTHQIRVHIAALRHPCVGDLTYGADPMLAARLGPERQWLHAVRLGFEHPGTGERVEFDERLPGGPRARPGASRRLTRRRSRRSATRSILAGCRRAGSVAATT